MRNDEKDKPFLSSEETKELYSQMDDFISPEENEEIYTQEVDHA